ncbi:hypothetical protein Sp245p_23230 (plasmid) [Azospirillum baldaniorum]|uniref:Uncharacterized protein n=1 Tax=Azospirillum baldaniorum TaxID=1064539 RepID=A0A9P1JZG0_9PROT|nr:hypothetical protein Sp245p_23230 [Azospirillum baldaniorum]CCD02705.1 protein of unknown function [Azospirillum baldaniorum]
MPPDEVRNRLGCALPLAHTGPRPGLIDPQNGAAVVLAWHRLKPRGRNGCRTDFGRLRRLSHPLGHGARRSRAIVGPKEQDALSTPFFERWERAPPGPLARQWVGIIQ